MLSKSVDKKQSSTTLAMAKEVMQKDYKYLEDLIPLFFDPMTNPVIVYPSKPVRPNVKGLTNNDKADLRDDYHNDRTCYNTQVKSADRRQEKLVSNKSALWALLWGQCSDAQRAKIRAIPNFSTYESTFDVYQLLTGIKSVMNLFDSAKHMFTALIMARQSLYTIRQGNMEDNKYLQSITTLWDVIENYKGTVGKHFSHAPAVDTDGNKGYVSH